MKNAPISEPDYTNPDSKKTTPERSEDYRPISCLEVVYKIFAKLLASRLMKVLPGIISPNQTTFIKRRRTTDAIGLAQEFTQSYKCRSTSRRACITIDFSKAFNILRWDAIETVLELLGVDEIFREIVMSCVMTASVSALVEGSPTSDRRGG